MKIVFVLECAAMMTNGTSASCLRFADGLRKKGHEVTLVGIKPGPDYQYPLEYYVGLEHFVFPIFEGIIKKEGFNFVKVDDALLAKAIKGADLVHTFLPFKLARHARLIANAYH
nr:hypothetical protein [Bacilli bacterium]